MSEFNFKCPHCGNALEADDEIRGQIVECPHCGKMICVPRLDRGKHQTVVHHNVPLVAPEKKSTSLLSVLWREPGYDSKDWLLPKFCRFTFLISLVLAAIFTVIAFVFSLYTAFIDFGRISIEEFLGRILMSVIIVPASGLLYAVILRVSYELMILLFRVFETNRDSLAELKRLSSLLDK